jgi:hypothetical protein
VKLIEYTASIQIRFCMKFCTKVFHIRWTCWTWFHAIEYCCLSKQLLYTPSLSSSLFSAIVWQHHMTSCILLCSTWLLADLVSFLFACLLACWRIWNRKTLLSPVYLMWRHIIKKNVIEIRHSISVAMA